MLKLEGSFLEKRLLVLIFLFGFLYIILHILSIFALMAGIYKLMIINGFGLRA